MQAGELPRHRQAPAHARLGAGEPATQQVRGRGQARPAGRSLQQNVQLRYLRTPTMRRTEKETLRRRHLLPHSLREARERCLNRNDRALRRKGGEEQTLLCLHTRNAQSETVQLPRADRTQRPASSVLPAAVGKDVKRGVQYRGSAIRHYEAKTTS